jgi:hypothetical protein
VLLGWFQVLKRQVTKSRAYLVSQKQTLKRIVKYVLIAGGLALFACVIFGAVLLHRYEVCRFPRYEFCEEFEYTIDLAWQMPRLPQSEFENGKIKRIVGGQIGILNISQDYGTYHIVANTDPSISTVRFKVCNRAQDKFWLKRMTTLQAKNVQKDKLGKFA